MEPKLEFTIEGANGEPQTLNDQDIMQQLQEAGYNPQNISPDGSIVTLQDAQGRYNVKLSDALSEHGSKVTGSMPMNADTQNVQPGWRAAIQYLPDDADKQAYIRGQMANLGKNDAQIMGSGRDWFVFNPDTSQWVAVTNSPEWDMSDLVEAGMVGARGLGSAVGAGLAGAGTMGLGAMGGAAAGGAGVDLAGRGIMAAMDPTFRQVAGKNLGGQALDVGLGAAMDAGTVGLLGGARALMPGLAKAAPVSAAMKGTGAALEGAGVVSNLVGKGLRSDAGRELGQMFIPAADTLGTAGYLAQAPSYLTRGIPRAMGWLGEKQFLQESAPEAARWLRNASMGLLKRASNPRMAEEMAARVGGPKVVPQATTKDVTRNLAEEGMKAFEKRFGSSGASDLLDAGSNAYHNALASGASEAEARMAAGRAIDSISQGASQRMSAAGTAGETIGRAMEGLEEAGKGAVGAARGIVGGVGAGFQGAGAAARTGGAAMRNAGTVLSPLEQTLGARTLAEEQLRPRLYRALSPSLAKRMQSTLTPEVLASTRYP